MRLLQGAIPVLKENRYPKGPFLGVKSTKGQRGIKFSETIVDERMSKFRIKQFSANIENQFTFELRLTKNIMEVAVLESVVYIAAAAV